VKEPQTYNFLFFKNFFVLNMKQIKKSDLPQKVCSVCGRPFSWRKKWEKVWAEVKYCSDACRKKSKAGGQ
jgi:hypothetical protein